MKKLTPFLIIALLMLVFLQSCSPDPKKILEGSYLKCQSIKGGYYEMDHYYKMMSRIDTLRFTQKSYFKKIPNDSVIPFVFNSYIQSLEMGEIHLLYTGDDLVLYSGNEGITIRRKDNEDSIWLAFNKNTGFNPYLPITYSDSKPIPNPAALTSGKFTPTYVKQEKINNILCYQVKAVVPDQFDCSVLKGYGLIIKTELNYWISKQDSIPIQITISRDLKVGKDTLVEFEKFILHKYDLNTLLEDSLLTLKVVPKSVSIYRSQHPENGSLLANGEIAPNWRLPSLTGDTLALADLKGKLVLLDFFFTNCPPCVSIVPILQDLYRRYKYRDFYIIGMDKIDPVKALKYFVEYHSIEYPILLANRDIMDLYHVSAYPTTYLIGRDGKILFSHIGEYDYITRERLEYIIQKEFK